VAKSRPYEDSLKEALADPDDAAAYLSAALADGDPGVFLLALKDVANVHGGVAKVARAARLNRESMYRMLSENGNPTVSSLNALLQSLGLRLAVTREKRRRRTAA
jgi:probable addiction module antidote protein